MTHYICVHCGVQYPDSPTPPTHCPICEDERQYVNYDGQQWTTLDQLRTTHTTFIREKAPGIHSIGVEPAFAIGQRALLVQAAGGNVLWDCITLIDDATVAAVNSLGGVSAIALSHPHYYSTIVEWSRAFGGAPVYIHAGDRQWVQRPDPCIVFWEGETHALRDGLTLVNLGIHFAGGSALHWRDGAAGRGVLFTGDIFQVVADRRWVSFMYSYPNLIPEQPAVIRRALERVEPFAFDQIYSAFWGRYITQDAKAAVWRSAERYLRQVE